MKNKNKKMKIMNFPFSFSLFFFPQPFLSFFLPSLNQCVIYYTQKGAIEPTEESWNCFSSRNSSNLLSYSTLYDSSSMLLIFDADADAAAAAADALQLFRNLVFFTFLFSSMNQ